MMSILKKRWFALLVLSALVLLVIWVLFFRPSRNLASLVPDHAAWYLEADQPAGLLSDLEKAIVPVSDSGLSFLREMHEAMNFTSLAFAQRKDIQKSLLEGTIGVSAHPVSESQTGYIFYLSSRKEWKEDVADALLKRFRGHSDYRISTRDYLGETVLEISRKKGATFSIAFINSSIVGSFSGFLVEDIIRNAGVILKPNFTTRLRQDPRFQQLEACRLRLFIQGATCPPFLQRFLSGSETNLIRQAAGSVVFGLQIRSDGNLNFDGFCLDSELENHSSGNGISSLRSVLPERELVLSFALGKPDLWKALRERDNFSAKDAELFSKALGNEFLIALAEGHGLKKYDHMLVAAVRDEKALNLLLQVLAGRDQPAFDYREEYRGISLFKHRDKQLAFRLAGPVLDGWSAVHYTVIGKNLVLSDRMELLRLCVDAAGEKKEVSFASELRPGRFHFEMAPAKLIPAIAEHANGAFRQHWKEWIPLLKAISSFRVADTGENENPGLTLQLRFLPPGKNPDSLPPLRELVFDTSVVKGPVVLNHNSEGKLLILAQDLKKKSYFIDANFKLTGSRAQPDFWLEKPGMLRRDREGQASVFFSFPNQVRVCNRYGDPEPDFSLNWPDSLGGIINSSLIDYDQSLQYRLFLASRYGHVSVADPTGKLLAGWNPKKIGSPLALAPRHLRIAGKDYILLVDRQGVLYLTNRKGEMQPGFPFRLKGGQVINWFAETGLDEESSFIYCLSDLGLMEKINLKGVQSSFIQLYRPDLETRFLLCPDQNERTFVVARITTNGLTLFDQSYRPVLEHKSEGRHFEVRHFQFGSAVKLFAITDLDVRKCRIYNEAGLPVINKPFPSDFGVEIFPVSGYNNRYRLISASGNKLLLSEFSGN